MKYPIEEIKQWADQGQAVSCRVVLDVIRDNLEMRSLILQAIEIISQEDPALLRRVNTLHLRQWSEKAHTVLTQFKREELG
jgi:hypothetical protein